MEDMLRAYVGSSYDEWDLLLPCCEFAVNNAFQASIRSTPFYVNLQVLSRKDDMSDIWCSSL